jgi:hypothetical protein
MSDENNLEFDSRVIRVKSEMLFGFWNGTQIKVGRRLPPGFVSAFTGRSERAGCQFSVGSERARFQVPISEDHTVFHISLDSALAKPSSIMERR